MKTQCLVEVLGMFMNFCCPANLCGVQGSFKGILFLSNKIDDLQRRCLATAKSEYRPKPIQRGWKFSLLQNDLFRNIKHDMIRKDDEHISQL